MRHTMEFGDKPSSSRSVVATRRISRPTTVKPGVRPARRMAYANDGGVVGATD